MSTPFAPGFSRSEPFFYDKPFIGIYPMNAVFCSRNEEKRLTFFNKEKKRELCLLSGEKMLKPLLEEFLKVEGVSAAVVVGRDGFVIESAVSGKVDIEALGAMASTGLGTSEAMGNSLGKGELSQMLVELEKGSIILSPLSAEEIIALVADTTANVGRIRYELKKNKARIVAAL
ncbi:MAG: roadblock/LC7 domain-containing protein [Methanoregula sp.]